MQQFSTPPHYAFAATWLANLKHGEQVLEPSAGTGSLAIHAENAGAHVITNELDPKRVGFLQHLFGKETFFSFGMSAPLISHRSAARCD